MKFFIYNHKNKNPVAGPVLTAILKPVLFIVTLKSKFCKALLHLMMAFFENFLLNPTHYSVHWHITKKSLSVNFSTAVHDTY